MQSQYKIVFILLLYLSILSGQQDFNSYISDGYIDADNTDTEAFEEYINQFIDNQLIWNNTKIDQIQTLPLNSFIKRILISAKKTNKKYLSWKLFKNETGFSDQEMEVVQLFFLLNEKELVTGKIYYYSGIKKYDKPGIMKNLSRAKFHHPNGWFLRAVAEQDRDELYIWDYTNLSIKSPEIYNSITGYFGAFRIKWGSGLFFHTNYMNSRNSLAFNNIKPANVRIANYTGTGENQYLFGTALNIKKGVFSFFPFLSSRNLDCRFDNNIVTGIDNSGFHITQMQIENRNRLHERILGFGTVFTGKFLNAGILIFNSNYSHDLKDLKNNRIQSGVSIYHNYQKNDFVITGELCYSQLNEYALVQTIHYIFDRLRFGVSGRYFSPNFYSTTGSIVKAYSGEPQNEKGVYYCFEARLLKGMKVSAFIDFFSRIKPIQNGKEIDLGTVSGLSISKRIYNKWIVNINFKRKSDIQYKQKQIKLKVLHKWSKNLSIIINYVENKYMIENLQEKGKGFQIYLKKQYQNHKMTFGIIHYFTPTWNSRIYIYEPGIPYRFSMPALSGTGNNYFITETIKFNEIFSFSFASKNIQAEIQMLVAF